MWTALRGELLAKIWEMAIRDEGRSPLAINGRKFWIGNSGYKVRYNNFSGHVQFNLVRASIVNSVPKPIRGDQVIANVNIMVSLEKRE